MSEDTVIKFILEEEAGRQIAAGGGPAPGPPAGWQSQYEAIRFGGAIPSPPIPVLGPSGPGIPGGYTFHERPPAPGAPGAATPSPTAPGDRLTAALENLTSAIRVPGKPPVRVPRAEAAPERVDYLEPAGPPPAPPPVASDEEPESEASRPPDWAAGAIGFRAGGAVARATGSPTMGGLASGGAQRGMGALASIGPAGVAAIATVGGIVLAGVALKETFDKLVSVTDSAAESIASVSPLVAGARAQAEVAQIQMQLRRAERIGPEMAAWTTARSQADIAIEDLKTAVVQDIAPTLTKIFELVKDSVVGVHAFYELVTQKLSWFETGIIATNPGQIPAMIQKHWGEYQEIVKRILDALEGPSIAMEQWEEFFTEVPEKWQPQNWANFPQAPVPQHPGIF